MADRLLLVSVGNSRTRFALVARAGGGVSGDELEPSRVETNADPDALALAIAAHRPEGEDAEAPDATESHIPVLLATVNQPVSDVIERSLKRAGRHVSRLGMGTGELPVPIVNTLDDPSTVGVDRLLDALGAFSRARAACVVIDAGTAITVDFVDGEGHFHGGAIAPGVRMMLEALHEKTAGLPLIALGPGDFPRHAENDDRTPPFGKATGAAIALGVVSAARGLAHLLIDRYAGFYEAYPRVIATGGDAPALFENDPLVEHIVPDLALVGMLEAYRRLEQLDSDEHERPLDSSPGLDG